MLTVLMASRNGGRTLPRVLAAYTEMRPPEGGWKLVLVDNDSDDDTAEIAGSFADRLPLLVLSEPRRGKNRALNAALDRIEGDLAVFSDDDTVPEADWLARLRAAADRHPEYAVFGGPILPLWDTEPPSWVLDWVRAAPVFSVTDAAREDGPCEATRVWGPNMAVRAEWFSRGYRFDERLGPTGSATYAMGGETEFTLRLAIAEQVRCWHCAEARVHHIIPAPHLTRAWILKRAFHLGRCVCRESGQNARAGRPHVRRDAAAIWTGLRRGLADLASARGAGDARREFEARWQINLWGGCLFEALRTCFASRGPTVDAEPRA